MNNLETAKKAILKTGKEVMKIYQLKIPSRNFRYYK